MSAKTQHLVEKKASAIKALHETQRQTQRNHAEVSAKTLLQE